MNELRLTYLDYVLEKHPNWIPDWDKKCLTRDFVNTKRFSPVIYNNKEKMPEIGSPNYEFWWQEQYKRCIMGYVVHNATRRGQSVWISGRMYFYLNFWIITAILEGTKRKGKRNPKFTSLDYWKFMILEMMFYFEKDNMFPKSRQKGFSEFGASNIAYNFIFLPGSTSVIVAGYGDYAEKTMGNVIAGLNNLGDSEFYKRRSPNRQDYIKSSYTEEWFNEETGEKRILYKGYGSEIYCKTAKDNTQALSGLTPFMVLYEEIGKWKQGTLKETREFVQPSLEAEGQKTGYQMFIGTGGDMDESVKDVEEMSYDPIRFNLLEFDNIWEEEGFITTGKVAAFVPGYEFEVIDEDGNSLIEESKTKLLNDWSKLKGAAKYRDMSLKPFFLSQMFLITKGNFLNEETIARLNDQKRRILNEPELQISFRANLDWIDFTDWNKGVKMTPDENGKFIITQEPEKDDKGDVYINLYNAATDSYDKDESESSFSQGSCTIYKGKYKLSMTREHWVARITERPDSIDGGSYVFYEDTIKLCIYYGGAINTIEYSNVLIFDFYKRKGFYWLLRDRPEMIISQKVENPKANQPKGVEQSFIPHALNMWKDYMQKNNSEAATKIFDIEMIEKFASFRRAKNYNCDITISCALNIVASIEDEEVEVYSESEIIDDDDYGGYKFNKSGDIYQNKNNEIWIMD